MTLGDRKLRVGDILISRDVLHANVQTSVETKEPHCMEDVRDPKDNKVVARIPCGHDWNPASISIRKDEWEKFLTKEEIESFLELRKKVAKYIKNTVSGLSKAVVLE